MPLFKQGNLISLSYTTTPRRPKGYTSVFELVAKRQCKCSCHFCHRTQTTILDKGPWDSENITAILQCRCITSNVVTSSAIILQIHNPPPSPPNTMLRDQRNCTLTVSTLSVGAGGRVEELYNCPNTFVYDCSFFLAPGAGQF